MSIPLVETPKELKYFLHQYGNHFNKKHYNHFERLVTGLIVSDKKQSKE